MKVFFTLVALFIRGESAGQVAYFQGLDKVTGRVFDICVPLNSPISFGDISLKARACFASEEGEPPEAKVFLEVREKEKLLFSGWMFASSPAINGLDHPVYDTWALRCGNQCYKKS